MSSPVIWIVFPLLAASILFFTRRWDKTTAFAGTFLAVALSALAWRLPIGILLFSNTISLRITDTMFVLGRRFVLENSDRPMLALIYLAAGFWFGGSIATRSNRMFVPFGLSVVALMTAALAVEPFLYAALLIEMAALLCIPIISPPGKPVRKGALRFLTFQTLGVPFILFAGWLLTGADAGPGNLPQVVRAAVLLAIGFCFLLAIFPFHTWIPILAEESHPYASAFVFFMLPGIVSLFGLSILERYAWLRGSITVFSLLQIVGAVMVTAGGVSAAFQRHLGRMLGYAVVYEIGLSLLVLGISQGAITRPLIGTQGTSEQLRLFFTLFLVRGLGLGAWAMALSVIQQTVPDLRFKALQGIGRRLPLASACVILAHLSLAGFPMLAGFPSRLAIWQLLAESAPQIAFWAILASLGLLAGGIRTLAVLVMGDADQPGQVMENRSARFFLSTAMLMLLAAGFVPYLIR
jgi:NADH-quinone oxidoreductase subunit N